MTLDLGTATPELGATMLGRCKWPWVLSSFDHRLLQAHLSIYLNRLAK